MAGAVAALGLQSMALCQRLRQRRPAACRKSRVLRHLRRAPSPTAPGAVRATWRTAWCGAFRKRPKSTIRRGADLQLAGHAAQQMRDDRHRGGHTRRAESATGCSPNRSTMATRRPSWPCLCTPAFKVAPAWSTWTSATTRRARVLPGPPSRSPTNRTGALPGGRGPGIANVARNSVGFCVGRPLRPRRHHG